MHRSVRTAAAAIALLVAGCGSDQDTPQATDSTAAPTTTSSTTTALPDAAPVDWDDRSTVDISLPGWHLTACEGDAPFLCASTPDGTIDGTIMLVEYPSPDGPTSQADFEAEAEDLYRVTEEDRQVTCGPKVELEPDPVTPATVGDSPGYRYGYQLRDASGQVTERVVLHVVTDGSRLIVINTSFSDPEGCPGEDPERNEFSVEAFTDIEPYLDDIVARSILPAATEPR